MNRSYELKSIIECFGYLEAGWDGDCAPRVLPNTIARGQCFVDVIEPLNVVSVYVRPCISGSIEFDFPVSSFSCVRVNIGSDYIILDELGTDWQSPEVIAASGVMAWEGSWGKALAFISNRM
jgi:hypothetical protein